MLTCPRSLVVLALLCLGSSSQQDSGRRGGRGSGSDGFSPARQVVRAADKERDEAVTAEEWAAFLASLEPGAGGEIDPVRLKARILVPMLDLDDDDVVTREDAMLAFKVLDGNEDYRIAKEELPKATTGRGANAGTAGISKRRRATIYLASLPIHVADADRDEVLTEDEWWPFVDGVEVDDEGAITDATLAAWWAHVREAMAGREGFTQGSFLGFVEDGLDGGKDGVLTTDDLQSLFDRLDLDGNGDIAQEELSFNPESFTPSAEERKRPPLMPWQRNLEDALALVEATGKPLLICVNMDGEMASESLAYRRYRDPEFVALVRGFVPLCVSPNRHDPLDHDDRGRRIVDQKFGRLTNAEHIDIERTLYERYFGGRRTAPRHLAVDAEGKVLFDSFLENDLTKLDEALRRYGLPDAEDVDPTTLSEEELLASPDAAHRSHLEATFLAGDEDTRARFASLAFSDTRRTQHPEIVRLAQADPAPAVRARATQTVARHAARASVDSIVAALQSGAANQTTQAALLEGLQVVALSATDEATRVRASRLRDGFAGLNAPSQTVDVGRWRVALSWAPAVGASSPESRDVLARRLAEFEERLAVGLDDPELNLAFAAANMAFAQLEIQEGRNPSLFLEDVIAAAGRATSAAQPSGRALSFLAWASVLLSDLDGAAAAAEQAVVHVLPWAGSALAAQALAILADTRMRALDALLEEKAELRPAWIADVRAAHEVLLAHPFGTENHALAYLRFLGAFEAVGEAERFLQRALQRFPDCGPLHAHLRSPALRAAGVDLFARTYAGLASELAPSDTLRWYEGLALLVAAERLVEQRDSLAALTAYESSVQAFRDSIESGADQGGSGKHHLCLAFAGLARLHLGLEQWEEAVAALRASVASSPASLWASDGLANTPVQTARLLHRSLVDLGREGEARSLLEFLSENDIRL